MMAAGGHLGVLMRYTCPMDKPILLIVDDEPNITRSLERSLRDQFIIFTAHSAEQALEVLHTQPVAVILTDQRMPGITGVELLERAKAVRPDAVGVLISGYTDVAALVDALNVGTVRGYLPKPWDVGALRQQLGEAARQYQAIFINRDTLRNTAEATAQLQRQIHELRRRLDSLEASNRVTIPFVSEGDVTNLRITLPSAFAEGLRDYTALLDQAYEMLAYRQSPNQGARALAEKFGAWRAGPRDVIEIHLAALKARINPDAAPTRNDAYQLAGRLLVLEVMGHLVACYRQQLPTL